MMPKKTIVCGVAWVGLLTSSLLAQSDGSLNVDDTLESLRREIQQISQGVLDLENRISSMRDDLTHSLPAPIARELVNNSQLRDRLDDLARGLAVVEQDHRDSYAQQSQINAEQSQIIEAQRIEINRLMQGYYALQTGPGAPQQPFNQQPLNQQPLIQQPSNASHHANAITPQQQAAIEQQRALDSWRQRQAYLAQQQQAYFQQQNVNNAVQQQSPNPSARQYTLYPPQTGGSVNGVVTIENRTARFVDLLLNGKRMRIGPGQFREPVVVAAIDGFVTVELSESKEQQVFRVSAPSYSTTVTIY